MLKTISKSIVIVVSIIVICISAVLYIVYTESGTQVGYNIIKRYLPGELTINQIKGTLAHHLSLQGIKYRFGEYKMTIQSATLDWQFAKLIESQTTEMTFHISNGVLTIPNEIVNNKHSFKGGKITALINDQGAAANINIDFIDNSKITGTVKAPKVHKVSQLSPFTKIQGELKWAFPDIHLLETVIPKINNIKGKFDATFSINGTIKSPNIHTVGEISKSEFKIPDLQSRAKNLHIKAETKKKKIHFTAKAKVGDGNLQAEGTTDLGAKNFQTNIHLTGDNARLIDMPLTQIAASPAIDIDLSGDGLNVRGDIFIPNGSIKTDSFKDTEQLPDDVEIIHDNNNVVEDKLSFPITSEVNLTLGNNIKLAIDGLKAKITGNLMIKEEPQKPTIATGQLKIVQGKFSLYGTTFNIDNGRLNYHGGPITDPGLNIRATRSFNFTGAGTNQLAQQKIIFGVAITGTAKKPIYTLFSEPGGYSQADILSYLFTGQPLSKLDGNDSKVQLLMQAAALVNIGGEGKLNHVRNQIKNSLGLSELDIQTSSEFNDRDKSTISHTALVLGKFLSPKLYLKYSFDILDHTNKLNVRYFLNKHWSIQTESSHSMNSTSYDSGVDVLYTIERN